MEIEINENPNCDILDLMIFNELEDARPIAGLRVSSPDGDIECDVVGIGENATIVDARAQKINDSGAGVAYLIFGGAWGLRFRKKEDANEPWDLSNANQWGDTHRIYGSEEDIFYKD